MFLSRPLSGPLAQLVEQLTFNQWVTGSNPVRLTTNIKGLAEISLSLLLYKPDIQPDKYWLCVDVKLSFSLILIS